MRIPACFLGPLSIGFLVFCCYWFACFLTYQAMSAFRQWTSLLPASCQFVYRIEILSSDKVKFTHTWQCCVCIGTFLHSTMSFSIHRVSSIIRRPLMHLVSTYTWCQPGVCFSFLDTLSHIFQHHLPHRSAPPGTPSLFHGTILLMYEVPTCTWAFFYFFLLEISCLPLCLFLC